MDLKDIQKKLKDLRDRIKEEGQISPRSEQELRDILNDTLTTANDKLSAMQNFAAPKRAGNDNFLTDDQKKRLRVMEKTGTGSNAVH